MVENKVHVNFTCQRCLQPLKLDPAFSALTEQTIGELSVPLCPSPGIDLEAQASGFDRFIPPFRLTDSTAAGTNGFMLVGGDGEYEGFSHHYKVTAGLFDALSNNSDIDHPLCEECTDSILELLDHQLRLTENEQADYKEYLQRLQEEQSNDSLEELEAELEKLTLEEQQLIQDLESLKKQESEAKAAVEKQQAARLQLEKEEEKYWREYTKHRRDLLLTEDETRSLECQLVYTRMQLKKLKDTNVFNATFHIWHSGHFGTINNFRLGRLPSAPVDWSEINAAWGQTALLLASLARKINLTFERYRLVPYGNHSYIEVLADHKELPLYGSGGFRFLWDNKFDAAMVAFLDLMQQFKEEVERGESGFCLPYRVEKGKVEDTTSGNSYSIKIQFNSEEQWTKALKFLLTNLKWGLAWVSAQFSNEDEDV
ncbi:beclin-1-like protein [Neocloeon triangulifer]|uniref:beclin-1-like protein n=1 Tax=Neocloeon triangulifer TaxID=2078957 RepID=UPI00286F20B3|nr:beclin-1-like protein [Neocloeon triangulifer]